MMITDVVVVGFCAAFTSYVLVDSDIFVRPRELIFGSVPELFVDLLSCRACSGWWAAVAWGWVLLGWPTSADEWATVVAAAGLNVWIARA